MSDVEFRWVEIPSEEAHLAKTIAAIDAAIRTPGIYELITPRLSNHRERYVIASNGKDAQSAGAWLSLNGAFDKNAEHSFRERFFGDRFLLHRTSTDDPDGFCNTHECPYTAAVLVALQLAYHAGIISHCHIRTTGNDAVRRLEGGSKAKALYEWMDSRLDPFVGCPEHMLAAHEVGMDHFRYAELRASNQTSIQRAAAALAHARG